MTQGNMISDSGSDKRIGFACKFVPDENTKRDKADQKQWLENHNLKSTTVTHLKSLGEKDAVKKLEDIIHHNCQTMIRQFEVLGAGPKALRMMRIGSEVMSCFTHESIRPLYKNPALIRALKGLETVGKIARKHDIRLSMHPGQWTSLCSNSQSALERSIEDLEYHSEIFRLMGYDGSDGRQVINIHGGAKSQNFLSEFSLNLTKLSKDTLSWLSVENCEFRYRLDQILPLAEKVKICIDLHHHWIHEGNYLGSNDPRLEAVKASWRGHRPKIHLSWSHESVLENHCKNSFPNMALLEESGLKRGKLRSHSEGCWNTALSEYFLEFWKDFDLMIEAKSKNLAAIELFKFHQKNQKTG